MSCGHELELEHARAKLAVMREALEGALDALADGDWQVLRRELRAALAPDAGSALLMERRLLMDVVEAARTMKFHLKSCDRSGYADGVAIERRLCRCPRGRISAALAALDARK